MIAKKQPKMLPFFGLLGFFILKNATKFVHLFMVATPNVLKNLSVCPWQAFRAQSNVCKAGVYPSEATFRCSTVGLAHGLTHKYQTRLERLDIDKQCLISLSRKLINYRCKKFYSIEPRSSNWYHDTQHNYIQDDDTQHNNKNAYWA